MPGLLLFKSIPISDFVASESPEMVVRDYNEITFAQDGSEERCVHDPICMGADVPGKPPEQDYNVEGGGVQFGGRGHIVSGGGEFYK